MYSLLINLNLSFPFSSILKCFTLSICKPLTAQMPLLIAACFSVASLLVSISNKDWAQFKLVFLRKGSSGNFLVNGEANTILTAKSVPLRLWEDVAGGVFFFFFLNTHNLSAYSVTSVVNCSPPSSSVHEIFQAIILKWIAMPSSRESSQTPGIKAVSCVHCITGSFFTHLSHLGSPIT